MKKKLTLLFLLLILFITSMPNVKAFDITSKNVVLYNFNNEKIIYEKNKDEKISIASLTKIMTCLVAIENITDLNEKVTITWEDYKGLYEQDASVAGFKIGNSYTYQDLLYGLMLPSGADAANALTRTLSKGENFIEKMNKKAKELGMNNTNYKNAHGLDEEGHYSTVEDVLTLMLNAIKNPTFKKIITTFQYTTSDNSINMESTIYKTIKKYNLNIDYIIGGKTGYTDEAGVCLSSLVKYNDINYILITAGGTVDKNKPNHFLDSDTIYRYYFDNYHLKTIYKKDDELLKINTKNTVEDNLIIKANNDINLYLEDKINIDEIKVKYEGIKELTSKNKKNQKLGTIYLIYNNEILYKEDIILKQKLHFSLIKFILNNISYLVYLMIVISLVIIIKRVISIKH